VLPFVNLSAEKEQEYFSDGLAEEIINALTQVQGLKVIARNSAFAFKARHHLYKFSPANSARALECLERALSIDPRRAGVPWHCPCQWGPRRRCSPGAG